MKTFTLIAAALVALAASSSNANAQVEVGVGFGGRRGDVGVSVRIGGGHRHHRPPVVYCPPPVVYCPPPVVHCPPPVVYYPDIDVVIIEDVRVWVPATYGWRTHCGRRIWTETCPGYWTTRPQRQCYRGWWDNGCNSYVYRDRHGATHRHHRR